jgi:O-antigen/teichoic acid export membrane protein
MNDNLFESETVVSGIRWSGAIQFIGETVRVVVSVILARLLAPEDFGLLAMASVVTGFLVLFQYMGARGVIIQRRELPPDLVNSLLVLNLAFGLIIALGLILGASALATLYRTSEVAPVIRVLGVAFIITSIGMVPGSLLARDMRFDLIAKVRFIEVAVYGAVAIALAYSGWGVWALVAASLVSSVASTVRLWMVAEWRPRWTFNWCEVKKVIGYSLNLTGSSVVEYATRNVDRFIIGRWLGSALLGHYSMAIRFCLLPLDTIAPVLMRVLFPALSRLQDDVGRLQKIFLRACGGIAFIALPLMTGLCVVAGPFVLVLLGAKWEPVILLLMLLSPIGILRSVSAPANGILLATGRSDWLFRVMLVTGIAVTGSIFCGLNWGIIGVASAYAIVTVPLTYLRFAVAFRLVGLRFSDLVSSLRPYILATAIMAISVLACRFMLENIGFELYLVLVICVSLGIVVYVSMILFMRPPAVVDILRILPGDHKWLERLLNITDRTQED